MVYTYNQYGNVTSAALMRLSDGLGLINSFQDLINSYTLEEAGVRILDVGFSVVGCIPHPVSTAISTIWSIGGKDLFWITKRNQVDMFVEQQKLGVFGLPSNQPFK